MEFLLAVVSVIFIGLLLTLALTLGVTLLIGVVIAVVVLYIVVMMRFWFRRWRFVRNSRPDYVPPPPKTAKIIDTEYTKVTDVDYE